MAVCDPELTMVYSSVVLRQLSFLFFHHVAALPWGMRNDMLIMHAQFGKPGQPGAFCVNR